MHRRAYLAAVGSVGVVATAGCTGLGGSETLSDPTVNAESRRRRSLSFTADGEEIGSFGVDGTLTSGTIDLGTELWHREGTLVESIRLRVWMPPPDASTRVAVVSPVEGDSSPPPSLSLSTPRRAQGEIVEITDLDDLADETISTLELLVRPGDGAETTLHVDVAIDLTSDGWLGTDHTLEGELQLEFPELEME